MTRKIELNRNRFKESTEVAFRTGIFTFNEYLSCCRQAEHGDPTGAIKRLKDMAYRNVSFNELLEDEGGLT